MIDPLYSYPPRPMVLRYPGGKTRAVKHILEKLPSDPQDTYVSPFFGGGSLELELARRGMKIIANDKFEPLITFWKQLKHHSQQLRQEVESLLPFTKDKFHECRSNILNTTVPPLRRAAMYFALNRASFSGATLSGGFSQEACNTRFNHASISRLTSISPLLENIEFYNMDFADFLSSHGNRGTLYLDPPYLLSEGSNRLYGNRGDLHELFDHQYLSRILLSPSITKPWVLSYNDTEGIRTLYSQKRIEQAAWSYGMNKSKRSSEVLIFSD